MGRKRKPDRLSVEVAQALAAGMSYGKWKAMQPPDVPTTSAPKAVIQRTCQVCGKVFWQSDRYRRKYCSVECRYEADTERQRGHAKKWRDAHPDYNKSYLKEWKKHVVSKV